MMNKFIRAVEMSTANVNAYVADTEGFVDGWLAGGAGPDAAADDRVLTPEERTAFVERDYGRCTVSARTPICSGTSPKRSTSTSTPRVPDGGNSWSATAPRSSRTARSTTSPDPASPRAPGAPDSRRGFAGPAAHRFRGTSVGRIRPRAVRAGTYSLHPSELPTGGPPGASARARRMPRGWGFHGASARSAPASHDGVSGGLRPRRCVGWTQRRTGGAGLLPRGRPHHRRHRYAVRRRRRSPAPPRRSRTAASATSPTDDVPPVIASPEA